MMSVVGAKRGRGDDGCGLLALCVQAGECYGHVVATSLGTVSKAGLVEEERQCTALQHPSESSAARRGFWNGIGAAGWGPGEEGHLGQWASSSLSCRGEPRASPLSTGKDKQQVSSTGEEDRWLAMVLW